MQIYLWQSDSKYFLGLKLVESNELLLKEISSLSCKGVKNLPLRWCATGNKLQKLLASAIYRLNAAIDHPGSITGP
jgi:hypothetical protein